MRIGGAVLAGGRSSRMGRTKALIEVDGRAMADRVIDAVRAAGCAPVVLYGGDPDELDALSAPVEPDRFPDEGPVGAVLGALELFVRRDPSLDGLVVVPCDIPDLAGHVLDRLIDAAGRVESNVDVVVGRTDRREPLCGVWLPRAIEGLQAGFDAGERALHAVLDDLSVIEVDVPSDALRNVNAPGDLDR